MKDLYIVLEESTDQYDPDNFYSFHLSLEEARNKILEFKSDNRIVYGVQGFFKNIEFKIKKVKLNESLVFLEHWPQKRDPDWYVRGFSLGEIVE